MFDRIVQVTDTNERSMEVRVLVSATDAGKAFDLRCELREKLIAWMHRHHPDALPRLRWEAPPNPTSIPA